MDGRVNTGSFIRGPAEMASFFGESGVMAQFKFLPFTV
jgi:hypothetical protein